MNRFWFCGCSLAVFVLQCCLMNDGKRFSVVLGHKRENKLENHIFKKGDVVTYLSSPGSPGTIATKNLGNLKSTSIRCIRFWRLVRVKRIIELARALEVTWSLGAKWNTVLRGKDVHRVDLTVDSLDIIFLYASMLYLLFDESAKRERCWNIYVWHCLRTSMTSSCMTVTWWTHLNIFLCGRRLL